MKKLRCLWLLIPAAFVSLGGRGQSVDEIISKHIEARGGLDKIIALKTMIAEGSIMQGGNEIDLKFYFSQNKAARVEYSVMGQTGYNIITPTAGWSYNPFTGNTSAEPIPEKAVKSSQSQLDLQGPFVNYQEKGNKVEYLGKENQQGKDYYKLRVTRSDSTQTTYYLNSDYLIAKVVGMAFVQGQEQEVTMELSDYRKSPEGYVLPYQRSGPGGNIVFQKYQINPEIDDALFQPGEN